MLTMIIVNCSNNSLTENTSTIKTYNDHLNDIYDLLNNFYDINIIVQIDYDYIIIKSINSFVIDECYLYINDSEIEFANHIKNYYIRFQRFYQGETYNIRLIINGIHYEVAYIMPYRATLNVSCQAITHTNYLFSWDLYKNYNFQYVGISLEEYVNLGDIDYWQINEYVISELPSSHRKYTININKLPSSTEFVGIFVSGLNFMIEREILFISEVMNRY
jgi:hypothetical protein